MKAFLNPVNLNMANAEVGEYKLPDDGTSSPSRGQVLPDLCQSNTSKLYHAAKLDTMVPPALFPQYSKTHPCVAAKKRDDLRELGLASGKSYLKALEVGAMEESGAKRYKSSKTTASNPGNIYGRGDCKHFTAGYDL